MKQTAKYIIIALLIAYVDLPLVYLAAIYEPIIPETSQEFWKYAACVDVEKDSVISRSDLMGFGNGIYPPTDSWFFYYIQGFRQRYLLKVSQADAMKDFPKVIRILKKSLGNNTLAPYVNKGFNEWLWDSEKAPNDGLLLVENIHRARLAELRLNHPELYHSRILSEEYFIRRWKRIRRYLLSVVFEFVYLTGLILFTAWPWLRNKGRTYYTVCFGLFPVLLFLPYLLGYPPDLSHKLSGAFIYPAVIMPFVILIHLFKYTGIFPFTLFDLIAFRAMPRPLETLSQFPCPEFQANNFMGIGHVSILYIGMVVGVLTFTIITINSEH